MKTALALMLMTGTIFGTALGAYPARDPDWPCEAVKVPELSLASVWNGPDLGDHTTAWQKDQPAADLAQRLAQRRVGLDEANREIKAFAAGDSTAKQGRLLDLMGGLFSILNEERASVVAGLSRFGRRQKELAAQLRGDLEALHTEQDKPAADPGKVTQLSEKVTWGTRTFTARAQSIRYACEVPNIIEQRLFALARTIQRALAK